MAANLAYRLGVTLESAQAPGAALASEAPFALSYSGLYEQGSSDRHVLTGAGTKNLDFGTVSAAGAKGILVYYEAGSAPITVGGIELTQGGIFLVHNPAPTAGETALAVVHTADATIRCRILA